MTKTIEIVSIKSLFPKVGNYVVLSSNMAIAQTVSLPEYSLKYTVKQVYRLYSSG